MSMDQLTRKKFQEWGRQGAAKRIANLRPETAAFYKEKLCKLGRKAQKNGKYHRLIKLVGKKVEVALKGGKRLLGVLAVNKQLRNFTINKVIFIARNVTSFETA